MLYILEIQFFQEIQNNDIFCFVIGNLVYLKQWSIIYTCHLLVNIFYYNHIVKVEFEHFKEGEFEPRIMEF